MLRPIAYVIGLLLLVGVASCKINQTRDGLRTGLWITKEGDGKTGYKSKGRYKKGQEKGVWKYSYNDTLYQKDKYSGNSARVRFYHPNKKVRAIGRTQMDFNGKLAHWYYNGDWKYFDIQGNLVKTVTYKKGNPIAETPASKQTNN